MRTTTGIVLFGIAAFALAWAGIPRPVQTAPKSPPPPSRIKSTMEARANQPKEPLLTWETLNPENKSPERKDKLVLTDEQWKARLTKDQFDILRSHGTDPAFCGILEDNKETGVYFCGGCELPLFVSDTKFNSGTGWPSFFAPYSRKNVWFRTDKSYGMVRVEVLCARCDGHLGHVFPDGPPPTNSRFCINGSALQFVADSKG